ncbi:hypothetical protein GA0116948_11029 [Chitinophaga costaii]|uniref:Uncharacterized protein n=1 Tax=Chitinophaga costaii TaxID=1335309 RepID=A0A1C4EV31_9BACT|nr:hypothetical protein GA0116948_11029 [Chitinophaga costaii]
MEIPASLILHYAPYFLIVHTNCIYFIHKQLYNKSIIQVIFENIGEAIIVYVK